ncbi:BsuBI/PstI family type II restriction endonuclease [Roseiflexus sp.]
MPDVLVYDTERDWLFVIEAVTSSGSIDGKRRKEWLLSNCSALASAVWPLLVTLQG